MLTWNPLYTSIVKGWVQSGLLILSALLVHHHIVTADQSEQLSTMWLLQIMNSLPAVASFLWDFLERKAARVKYNAALSAAKTTDEDLSHKVALGLAAPAATTPAHIVPTVLVLLCAGLALASCAGPLQVFQNATSTEIANAPKALCGSPTALPTPACLTQAQVNQIETDLGHMEAATATYAGAVMAAAGDALKLATAFGVFMAAVVPAYNDIVTVAGPNVTATLKTLQSAVSKL